MSFDKALRRQRSLAQRLTRKRSSWSPKLKRDSSKKTTCQSDFQDMSSGAHCRGSRRWFAMRGILYKGTLTRNPWCSRRQRIDEADISTLIAVNQRAANCLEEAIWSFTIMRSSRTDVTFRRPLLPNSHNCGTVPLHTSSYCVTENSSFLADNPLPFKP
ncbi:uncharacterized protein TNCV_973991 [Trichonephila clavipes]|nr:uncharacterized protein TNCV_973991 [Trichonephila clavipes]